MSITTKPSESGTLRPRHDAATSLAHGVTSTDCACGPACTCVDCGCGCGD